MADTTRKEQILAYIAGESKTLPKAYTREEKLLVKIAENTASPGGGGGGSGSCQFGYIEGDVIPLDSYPLEEGMFVLDNTKHIELIKDETYTVEYNENVYHSSAKILVSDGTFGMIVGNMSFITGGEDTGEPFVMMFTSDTMLFSTIEPLESITLRVSGRYIQRLESVFAPVLPVVDLMYLNTYSLDEWVTFTDEPLIRDLYHSLITTGLAKVRLGLLDFLPEPTGSYSTFDMVISCTAKDINNSTVHSYLRLYDYELFLQITADEMKAKLVHNPI